MGPVRASLVGSLPKPSSVASGEGLYHRLFAPWSAPQDELQARQDAAVDHWIKVQENAGLDIVTDGEQRRRHYIWGFLAGLEGVDLENLAMKRSRGGRYQEATRVARIVDAVKWKRPVLVDAVAYARARTDRTLKVTLPGPMTIADSVLDEVGGREDAEVAAMFADMLNREAKAVVEAGADIVQFDEPCFNIYLDEVEAWGIETLEHAAAGVDVTTAVHICYGYGTPTVMAWKTQNKEWGHYGRTLPLLAKSSIDQISVETAASGVVVSVVAAAAGKDIMLGVINVGVHEVETVEEVAARLRAALQHVAPEHLIACTDCGMVPLPMEVAEAKVRVLGEATALVNAELARSPSAAAAGQARPS